MSRIKKILPTEMNEAQLKIYKDITTGERAKNSADFSLVGEDGGLEGPFNAMLLNPVIGDTLQRLGTALRYHGQLSDRSREIAILVVAAYWKSPFEQRAHEHFGACIGLSQEEIQSLHSGNNLIFENEEEAAVLWATRLLLHTGRLDQEQYVGITKYLHPEKIFELTTLIGYYSLLAMQMHVFEVK